MKLEEVQQLINESLIGFNSIKVTDIFSKCLSVILSNENKGFSKIGGLPCVPEGFKWPVENRKIVKKKWFRKHTAEDKEMPLSFLAQISLSEVANVDNEFDLLPSKGVLYFFYCNDQDSWGIYPSDVDKFKVIYIDCDLAKCKLMNPPESMPKSGVYNGVNISFESSFSLKSVEEDEILSWIDKNEGAYEFLNDMIDKEPNYIQMLGSPFNIQGEMKIHATNMINMINSQNDYGKEDLVLLLQLDSINECNMNWGDGGMLYFWIPKKCLEDKKFNLCWCILQCY